MLVKTYNFYPTVNKIDIKITDISGEVKISCVTR